MALTFLNDSSQTSSGQKVFLNDWIKENPKNKKTQHLVSEVKLVQSGKGYLLETDYFLAFIWKNAKVTKQLIEALEHWVDTPDTGYALYLIQDKPCSPNFKLATDKEEPFTWYRKKKRFFSFRGRLKLGYHRTGWEPFSLIQNSSALLLPPSCPIYSDIADKGGRDRARECDERLLNAALSIASAFDGVILPDEVLTGLYGPILG